MKNVTRNRMALPTALILLLLLCLPVPAFASGIAFRNETGVPVVVQGASQAGVLIVRGRPLLILPGRVTVDANLGPGIRQITIYDPNRRNRILFKENIPFAGQNLFFAIRVNPLGQPFPLRLVPLPPNLLGP